MDTQIENTNNNKSISTVRLKRYLLFLLAFLPAIAILSLLLLSNINNERALLKQARTLLSNTTAESIRHTHDFLSHAENHAKLTSKIIQLQIISAADFTAQENYLVSQLDLHAAISGLYVSDRLGNFFFVSRAGESSGGKYQIKRITVETDRTVTNTWLRTASGAVVEPQTIINEDFDARERPWYKKAHAHDTIIWTEPYIFFTAQKLGITTAIPFHMKSGEFAGAIGVDLEFTELAEFLNQLEISRYGSSFIAASDGTLIASPSLQERYKHDTQQDKLQLITVLNSGDMIAQSAYQAVFEKGEDEFTESNKEFLVESMPLQLSGGQNWQIVTYADKNEFLSEIRKSENQEYLIAGLITMISILFGWILTRTAWKPIVKLQDTANYDLLTNLFNRRYLEYSSENLIEKAIEQDQPLCVAILDIDNFKNINDTYGHAIGDQVMQIFANRLRNQNRPLDLLARLGGEEFVMVMPNTTIEVAEAHINNCRITMKDRVYKADEYSLKVTFSAGIAKLDADNKNLGDILKLADKALYASKNSGRDKVTVS